MNKLNNRFRKKVTEKERQKKGGKEEKNNIIPLI